MRRDRDGARGDLRRDAVRHALLVVLVAALGLLILSRLSGARRAWSLLSDGDPWWLALAFACELASYAGYVVLLRAVINDGDGPRIGLRFATAVTLAGVAASRLLSAAGVGGIVLTAWALRRAGVPARTVAHRLGAFFVLLYGLFMAALVVGGLGLRFGLWPGPAPFALTVVPALFGAVVIVTALGFTLLPAGFDGRVRRAWPERRRGAHLASRLALVPETVASGVRGALELVRRGDPHLLGAVAWWAFDVAVLWCGLRAFGTPPPLAVLVMAYCTGQLANVLPLPGGVGGVESGMIGALAAFGVPLDLAIAGVLAYRAFAFWLPILPGAIAYTRLRSLTPAGR